MKCNSSLLMTLVEQSVEPGAEVENVARHLEQCERCRTELMQLGGDEHWWNEACEWLSLPQPELTPADLELLHQPAVDLSFLDPPTHPEMLGRIGCYEIESLLGHGGMGVVFRAYDSDLQRAVAVKVLAPMWAASATARQRFAREAQAAASVAHENVVPIYNVDASAKLPYIVMRYIPGMTLQRWVMTHGPLDVGTILRVAGQLAEGLAAAHRRGLVHRDIKPGNVLVGENIERVWITDFGLARAADSMMLTRTGVIAGTPHYMSPEQARGEAIDHRSDLFSLGCVLYFLCCGHPPFDAENTLAVLHKIVSEKPKPLAQERDDLPPSLARLVHQLLQRSIDRRPQDCQAVIDDIAKAQTEHQSGRRTRPRMNAVGRRLLALSAVGGLLLAVTWGLTRPMIDRLTPSYKPAYRGSLDNSSSSTPKGLGEPVPGDPTIAYVADQIAASLDDPKLALQYAHLETQFAVATRPPATVGGDTVELGQSQWNRYVAGVEHDIHQLQGSAISHDLVIVEDEQAWHREIVTLESAIRRAMNNR